VVSDEHLELDNTARLERPVLDLDCGIATARTWTPPLCQAFSCPSNGRWRKPQSQLNIWAALQRTAASALAEQAGGCREPFGRCLSDAWQMAKEICAGEERQRAA